MEPWQLEVLDAIRNAPWRELESKMGEQRVYLSSELYGKSLYHIVQNRQGAVQIEQLDVDEKWSKRLYFPEDEVDALINVLLQWRFLKQQDKRAAAKQGGELDDLDEAPF